MRLLIFAISFLFIIGCVRNEKKVKLEIGKKNPWTHTNFQNNGKDFKFALLSDRTGGERIGVFQKCIEGINLLGPDFVVSVGDLIEGYSDDTTEIIHQWDELESITKKLNAPLFFVPGNHDYTTQEMADVWNNRFGRTYHHMVYNDVLFLFMNSEVTMKGSSSKNIMEEQFNYFKDVLSENNEVQHTFVILHKPLWKYSETGYWEDIEKILSKRKHSVLAGHGHYYVKYERNGGDYIMFSTSGGSGGNSFGRFDHVTLISMQKGNPVIANIMIDGLKSKDYITEEFNSIAHINPFEFDPVFLKEDINQNYNIKINNDLDIAMNINMNFPYHPDFIFPHKDYQFKILPGKTETIAVKRKNNNDNYQFVPPINTKIYFDLSGHDQTPMHRALYWRKEKANNCKKSIKPIIIDGNINEWRSLTHKIFRDNKSYPELESSNDIIANFDVKNDGVNLYLAVKVIDNSSFINENLYHSDATAIFFDFHSIKDAFNHRGSLYKEKLQYFHIIRGSHDSIKKSYDVFNPIDDTRFICKETKTGYNIELSIPLEEIYAMQENEKPHFRLNFIIYDYISEADRIPNYWQPDWRSEENIMGSGMFFIR